MSLPQRPARRVPALAATALLLLAAACTQARQPLAQTTPPPPAAAIADPPQTRLVVLMITDNTDHQHPGGEDGSIATGITRNAALMGSFVNGLAARTGLAVDIHTIVGAAAPPDPFNCDNIDATIQALPVSPTDAVLIYYAGHGFNVGTDNPALTKAQIRTAAPPEFRDTGPTRFPFLACSTDLVNTPNLDMIATWVARKHPRLTVVMADACNSFLSGSGPPAERFFAAAAIHPLLPEPRLRSLFAQASGTVLITGSQPGHYSYYTLSGAGIGGVLTLEFLDIFSTNKLPPSQPTTWTAVGALLTPKTLRLSDSASDTQTPLMNIGPPFTTTP